MSNKQKEMELHVSNALTENSIHLKCNFLDKKFTAVEIQNGIKRLKSNKACGMDSICNELLKAVADIITPILVSIFNKIIDTECFPTLWSLGIIVPIFKDGDASDPNNYRGICINSCLSKLFTMLMNDRLVGVCESRNLIHFNQIGFRKGFRTADHVFTMKTMIDKSFYDKKKLYVCFVDFRKAYDTVWRDALYYKLITNGISKKFVKILHNMYSKLNVCVQLKSGLTFPFPSKIGLKQGCNLSPILFNIFINDFVTTLNEYQSDAPSLGNIKINCLLYADDLILFSESAEGLQASLDQLHTFTKKWNLSINPRKTKCMIVEKSKRSKIQPTFSIGDSRLENCESYTYLGHTVSANGSLKSTPHILYEKALKALYSLLSSINKFSACDVKLLLQLYDKMIAPILLYGCEVWGVDLLPTNINNTKIIDNFLKSPVEKLHCKMLKKALGVGQKTTNWAVYTETGRYPHMERVITSIFKYVKHIATTNSPILYAAFNTNKTLYMNGYKSWYGGMKRLANFCSPEIDSSRIEEIDKLVARKSCKIKNRFDLIWENSKLIHSSGKLDFYILLNPTFCLQPYINDIKCFKLRQAITKLRISAHKFPIETGRYDKKERHQRICPLCCEEVGDEKHYIISCKDPCIKNAREPFINKFSNPTFNSLSDHEKCIWILSLRDPQLFVNSGTMCLKILEAFKEFAL